MNILIIGQEVNYMECKLKFGDRHTYLFAQNHEEAKNELARSEVIFDFLLKSNPTGFKIYLGLSNATVFAEVSKISLMELGATINHGVDFVLFGFCGLPTFLNRSHLEVSLYKNQHKENLERICDTLQTQFAVVDDRVGLSTSRIICMIINEAYYTVQEGTATREDIDLAMKLGTNYPYGPFEWASRIGIINVFELLEAVYEDTKDERYKICPLLKKEYNALA